MSAPSAPSRTRQGQDYLAAVEHELADLRPEDRSALLEDLSMHLEALAAEDDDRGIVVRLGPPAGYAEELRAAAGLPARGSGGRPGALGLRERVDRAMESDAYRRALPALREVRRLLVELRPAWWVLRGYLAVHVLSAVTGGGGGVVPAVLGSRPLGLVVLMAAVAGSVVLGRRMQQGSWPGTPARALIGVAGVLLVLMSLAAWKSGSDETVYGYDHAAAPEQAMGQYPLLSRYGPVTDVFPYAADGTPLEGVLLYDQDGRPLEVGFQEWWADGCARVLEQPVAADGVPVPNVFPQSYELDPYTVPMTPGACAVEVRRPAVPLPALPDATSPASESPATAPPAPEQSVAPAPGN